MRNLFFALLLFLPTQSFALGCHEIFANSDLNSSQPNIHISKGPAGFLVNEHLITSSAHYPLEIVQRNLGFEALPIQHSVLSLGEGMSNLVSTINKIGGKAIGLDIWYDNQKLPSEMQNYVTQNREYLKQGDATQVPFEDKSFDIVVSHALLSNLSSETATKTLFEMLRVARREVRIGGPSWEIEPLLAQVREKYGDKVQIVESQFRVAYTIKEASPFDLFGRNIGFNNRTVVIRHLP